MLTLNLVTEYPTPGQCVAPGMTSLESTMLRHGVCLVNVTSSTTEQERSQQRFV